MTSSPPSFDDRVMGALFQYARPLSPSARGPFLELVAQNLRDQPELGPGVVNRVIRDCQRQFLDQIAIGVAPFHARNGYKRRAKPPA